MQIVGSPGEHAQAIAAAMGGGILGELDSGDVEITARLLQEEAVGATELQQSAAVAVLADELHGAGKLAAQHLLGGEIIGVAVGMPAREIIPRVILGRV